MSITNEDATITFGDGVITMRRKGNSAVTVAGILGVVEKDEAKFYYLDRLIHKPHERTLDRYTVHGARTSILVEQIRL